MKKLCSLMLFAVILLSLCACGNRTDVSPSAPEETAAETETVTTDTEQKTVTEGSQSPKSDVVITEENISPVIEKDDKETIEGKTVGPQSESETNTLGIKETEKEISNKPDLPAEEPEPYSQPTSDTVLKVIGSALSHDYYFSMSDIYSFGGVISDNYFSRGKEPQEMTTYFTGISVEYLLSSIIGVSDYKKAIFTASDGYSGSYSRYAIGASYINEKAPSASLSMILAWEEDASPCALRLVMGQQVEGEYNRTYWIRDVITIEVIAA